MSFLHPRRRPSPPPPPEQTSPGTIPWIGLYGRAGAGKDTAAHFICAHSGAVKVSFADPVRRAVLVLDPLVMFEQSRGELSGILPVSELVAEVGWEKAKRSSPDLRGLLQRMGTEVGREMFGSPWIPMAMERATSAARPVVFSDVRFPDEADAIKERSGVIVEVTGRAADGIPPHSSETAMADYTPDFRLFNTGPMSALRDEVLTLLSNLQRSNP